MMKKIVVLVVLAGLFLSSFPADHEKGVKDSVTPYRNQAISFDFERQWAFIIAINRYAYLNPLKYPVKVYIPAGEFTMGSNAGKDDEKPSHKVYLDGYWMGKYEVTFDQYDKYCDEIKKEKPDDRGWGRGKRPVVYVTWEDAVAYCEWLAK